MIRNVFRAAVVVTFCLSARTVGATPNFPAAIQAHLGADRAPECSVCHVGGQTARGTVNTPFGSLMRSRGLVAYDEDALRTALDAIASEKKDSDRDGTIDLEELRKGGNPNLATGADGGVAAEPLTPEYGCTAAPGGATGSSWLWAMAAFCALVQRSRSRLRALSAPSGK